MNKKVVLPLMIALAIILAWRIIYPSGFWRYKLTVAVETPEGIKIGSAVREIYGYTFPPLLGVERDTFLELQKGEAVVVDLGHRGVLFVLMSIGGGSGQAIALPSHAFPTPCKNPYSRCGVKYFSNLQNTGKIVLEPRHYSGMVHFKNLNDPHSVQRVIKMKQCVDPITKSPYSHCIKEDHFSRIFGEGVALKSLEVEMTQEEITPRINRFLPWLEKTKGYIDGQPLGGGPELSNILEKSDFVRKDQ